MDKNDKKLTLEEIKKFVPSLESLNTIAITGGEPLLHKDVLEICKIFLEKVPNLFLLSNGSMPKKLYSVIKELAPKYKNKSLFIQLSLDGLEKTHNELRRVDSFRKVIESIELISELKKKNKNIQIFVCASISKKNVHELTKFHKFISNYNIDGIRYNFVRGTENIFNLDKNNMANHNPSHKDIVIRGVKKWEKIYDMLVKADEKIGLWKSDNRLIMKSIIRVMKAKKKIFKCYSGITNLVLYPDGDCTICEYFKPFGNIRNFDYDFRKMYKSDKYKRELAVAKKCECVHNCHIDVSINLSEELLYEVVKNRTFKENVKIAKGIILDKIHSFI